MIKTASDDANKYIARSAGGVYYDTHGAVRPRLIFVILFETFEGDHVNPFVAVWGDRVYKND